MNSAQIQLRLTLSKQLYVFLKNYAGKFGLTITQIVRQIIIEKMEEEEYKKSQNGDKRHHS